MVRTMIIKRVKNGEQEYDIKHWVELHDDCEDRYVIGVYKADDYIADYLESCIDMVSSLQRYDYIVDNIREFV